MYLIQKGKKPQPICRECRRGHKGGVCPKAEPEFEGPVMPSTEVVRIIRAAKEEVRRQMQEREAFVRAIELAQQRVIARRQKAL
jgi:hypothetical protein